MTLSQKSVIFGAALLLSGSAIKLHAQGKGLDGRNPCFAIHVRLNGKTVAGPQVIILKSKGDEKVVSLEGGCFRVPPALLKETTVDVSSTLPRDKVYLSAIPTGFLTGPWDVDLEDKQFGKEVVLPRHSRTAEVCAVVFHVGEPETAQAMTGCRKPIPPRGTEPD